MIRRFFLAAFFSVFVFTSEAQATFSSGSTGADGAFNPVSSMTLTVPDNGIFNFTTVNIASGVTITFRKNTANTPVYILATGDVNVSGTIKIDGQSSVSNVATPGTSGPGGFNGGYGGPVSTAGGKGLGPGGGTTTSQVGYAGGYGTAGVGAGGGPVYGSARIIPLIGGSGGGGCAGTTSAYGTGAGGGGGAIVIASSTSITINGTISANGGDGIPNNVGAGSGGAIRLIANTIAGNGTIVAKGGNPTSTYVAGGNGRIRIEASTNTFSSVTTPVYIYGQPGNVFPSSVPVLSLYSIASTTVPTNPGGLYAQPDILLPNNTTNPVSVVVQASNIPVGTTVAVSAVPQYGSPSTGSTTLSGTLSASTGTASVTLSTTYSNVITAQATFTLLASILYDNESINAVRIATSLGGGTQTTYITASGREVEAEKLILAGLIY